MKWFKNMFKQTQTQITHDDLVARIEKALRRPLETHYNPETRETTYRGHYWKLFEKKREGDYVVIGDQVDFDRPVSQEDGRIITYRESIKNEQCIKGHRYFVAPTLGELMNYDNLAVGWMSELGLKPTFFEKGQLRSIGMEAELWLPYSVYTPDGCAFNFTITPSEDALRTASNISHPVEYWRYPFTPTIYLGLRKRT